MVVFTVALTPKCRYRAEEAQAARDSRLVSSRQGVDATEEDLARINAIVAPLVRRGWSFEAIHAAHAPELGVSARTLYNYQELGILETSNVELPRKARMRPRRRRREEGRPRADRTGGSTPTSSPFPSGSGRASCRATRSWASTATDTTS